jgi:ubiquinone/menaquinone biosynthesis C-methylase UbiE
MSDPGREERKFDPARAPLLDAPERDEYLPDATLVALLELGGAETVLDYGAGTGRVALGAAAPLPRGRVVAVDESPEMVALLRERIAATANVEAVAIEGNAVPLPDGSVDRVLAVNLLHEVRGETALAEMRRLLAPGGFVLIVDWDRDRPGERGPPAEIRYGVEDAIAACAEAGLAAEALEVELPHHFALRARASA